MIIIKAPQRGCQGFVVLFYLPAGLWMVCRGELISDHEQLTFTLEGLGVNSFQYLECSACRGPYLNNPVFQNALVTSAKPPHLYGATRTSLVSRLAIAMIYWKPRRLLTSGHRMSIATDSSGLNSKNNFKRLAHLCSQAQRFVQYKQFWTIVVTSVAICGKEKVCRKGGMHACDARVSCHLAAMSRSA